MPVILRTPEEVDAWMTLPWKEAKNLQKKLPDGSLQIVGRGRKTDAPGMPFETMEVKEEPAEAPPAQGSLF